MFMFVWPKKTEPELKTSDLNAKGVHGRGDDRRRPVVGERVSGYVYTHKYMYIYVYTPLHINMYIHIHSYIYIHTNIYAYIYIYMYTQTAT